MDAVAALLHVERLGPAGQGELAGRVVPAPGPGHPPGHAAHEHDPARGRAAQQRQQGLGEAHLGVEVDRHQPLHLGPPAAGEARPPTPALLTTRSRRPCSASTRSATSAGVDGSSRSAGITVAPPSSSASASSRSWRLATSTRRAPGSEARRRAVAAPNPLEAP